MKRRLVLASLLVIASMSACDGNFCLINCDGGQSNSGPSPLPSPSPFVSPRPSPSPSVSPSPSPSPSPIQCPLPPSVSSYCTYQATQYLFDQVATVAASPRLAGIIDPEIYIVEFSRLLSEAGVCNKRGPSNDEIRVKTSNGFSETYDFWNRNVFPQTLYIQTCIPAAF